jgi:hypothetical protein
MLIIFKPSQNAIVIMMFSAFIAEKLSCENTLGGKLKIYEKSVNLDKITFS